MAATLRGADTISVQTARDLPEALAPGVLIADAREDLGRKTRLAAWTRRTPPLCLRLLSPFGEVALELGHGDQASAPLGLYRRNRRQDAPVERREAYPECLGSLRPRVRQPFDPVAQLDIPGLLRSGSHSTWDLNVASLLLALPALPSPRHSLQRTTIVSPVCIEMHLCLRWLSILAAGRRLAESAVRARDSARRIRRHSRGHVTPTAAAHCELERPALPERGADVVASERAPELFGDSDLEEGPLVP